MTPYDLSKGAHHWQADRGRAPFAAAVSPGGRGKAAALVHRKCGCWSASERDQLELASRPLETDTLHLPAVHELAEQEAPRRAAA